jgi:hypothetical protein
VSVNILAWLSRILSSFCLILIIPSPSIAGHLALESLQLRGGLSGGSPLGEEQTEKFYQGDSALTARLPWEWEVGSGWLFRTRALGSAGVLRGAQDTAGIFTVVPLDLAFGRKDGLVTIDMGGGVALLTRQTFGMQDFGGPFQFVWTFGITSRFAGPFGLGYHFQHYSDATLYGSQSRGTDLHLFEVIYWFETAR